MAVNRHIFIHDADRTALQALKSIPGFTAVLKAFMSVWDEKLFFIQNMSSNVRLSEKQLPELYNMLPPICDKLGIEVPALFMTQDDAPNAWTSGETKNSITITSGLLEKMPLHLVPTVLAHECGHIVCHHVLYRTMGTMLLNGMLKYVPMPNVALIPIQAAFFYWMRCSEFSADRAAILCDGKPDQTMELCMRLAGINKGVSDEMNMEAFMEQAGEYTTEMKENKVSKTMEFLLFGNADHPLHAVRAHEAKVWTESEAFQNARDYFVSYKKEEAPASLPLPGNEKYFTGRKINDVEKELRALGLEDIELIRITEKSLFSKPGIVTALSINGKNTFQAGEWIPADAMVELSYYRPLSDEEEAAMHPGEIKLPHAAFYYKGIPAPEAEAVFLEYGFENVVLEPVQDIVKEKDRNLNRVASVSIDGIEKFSKWQWFRAGAEVLITYHDMA